jgi:hypothetical protein
MYNSRLKIVGGCITLLVIITSKISNNKHTEVRKHKTIDFAITTLGETPTNPINFISGKELVPLPLRIQGFIDSRDQPFITSFTQSSLKLVEVDLFNPGLNLDLKTINDSGSPGVAGGFATKVTSENDHGYAVGGIWAALSGNNKGVAAALPAKNQSIVSIQYGSKDWMSKLMKVLDSPEQKVVNVSIGYSPEAGKPVGGTQVEQAKIFGAVFAKAVNSKGQSFKNKFIVVAAAGNTPGASDFEINPFAWAATLTPATINVSSGVVSECEKELPTYASLCSSVNSTSDDNTPGLENIISVQQSGTSGEMSESSISTTNTLTAVAYADAINRLTYGPCIADKVGYPALISNSKYGCVVSGTSYAAPQVAALVTLYWQNNPKLTSSQVATKLSVPVVSGENAQTDFPIYQDSAFVSRSFCPEYPSSDPATSPKVINPRKLLNRPAVYAQIASGLVTPSAITMQGENFYVVDNNSNGRLVKISPKGVITTLATGLGSPNGVAVDKDFIYVTDFAGKAVWRIQESTRVKSKLKNSFPSPLSIFALNGFVYVGSFGAKGFGQVSEISTNGNIRPIIVESASNPLGAPRSMVPICVDKNKQLWSKKFAVLDNNNNRIVVINTEGTRLETLSIPKEPTGKKWTGATFLGDYLIVSGGSTLQKFERKVTTKGVKALQSVGLIKPSAGFSGSYFGIFGNYYDLIVTDSTGGRLLQMTPYNQVTIK